MRRREEGLGFWLKRDTSQMGGRVKFGAVLGSWLNLPVLTPAAVDLSAEVEIDANLCTGSFLLAADVIDGLGFPNQNGCAPDTPVSATALETAAEQDAASPRLPDVNAVDFSWMTNTVVTSKGLMSAPPVRFRALWNASGETTTRSATLLDYLPAPTDPPVSFLPLSLPVHVGTPRFTRFPHSRRSVDLGGLGIQESERLVHEAEAVRGIEHGQGELLALFLSVPVEIVSRVRFVEETKQLLYTLMPQPGLTRTRVHDMLAVRERKTGETHLVPHRTRYRMAFLA
jgi:hypothetical protein